MAGSFPPYGRSIANFYGVGVSWKGRDATFIDAYRGQGELTSNLKAILFFQIDFVYPRNPEFTAIGKLSP
jgi:hypothetical protein